MYQIKLGSFVTGTLVPADRMAALDAELTLAVFHGCEFAQAEEVAAAIEAQRYLQDELEAARDGELSEHWYEVVDEAIDALQAFCAPFCYVGTLEGDGADLGCWFSFADFDQAVAEGDLVVVSDSSELDGVEGNQAAVVNDHGNVTVYVRDAWRSVVGVV